MVSGKLSRRFFNGTHKDSTASHQINYSVSFEVSTASAVATLISICLIVARWIQLLRDAYVKPIPFKIRHFLRLRFDVEDVEKD